MSQKPHRDASSAQTDAVAPGALTMHYRRSSLVGDYLRGGAGALIVGLPLILVDVHWLPGIILGSILVIFAAFIIRTAARHLMVVTVDSQGIRVSGPMSRSMNWSDLRGLSVKYFSTKRDRSEGWMTLRLDGAGTTIKLESALDNFDQVLDVAADAARRNDLVIDDVTRANLTAMAIDIGDGDSDGLEDGLKTEGWDWGAVSGDRKKRQ